MTKTEISKIIAKRVNMGEKEAQLVFDTVVDTFKEAMLHGNTIYLRGFGTFSTGERKARTARNLNTGELVEVPAKRVVRIKISKNFIDKLNGTED